MNTFFIVWKFNGIKRPTTDKVQALNLPAALATFAPSLELRVKGATVKRSRNSRRLEFWGYAGESFPKTSAPLLSGFIVKA